MMARQVSAVLVTSQLYWDEVEQRKRCRHAGEHGGRPHRHLPNGTITQLNAAARRALGIEGEWFGRYYPELIAE